MGKNWLYIAILILLGYILIQERCARASYEELKQQADSLRVRSEALKNSYESEKKARDSVTKSLSDSISQIRKDIESRVKVGQSKRARIDTLIRVVNPELISPAAQAIIEAQADYIKDREDLIKVQNKQIISMGNLISTLRSDLAQRDSTIDSLFALNSSLQKLGDKAISKTKKGFDLKTFAIGVGTALVIEELRTK